MNSPSNSSLRGITYYDEHPEVFRAAVAGRPPTGTAAWLARELAPGSLVVDAGCGVGIDAAFLASSGMQVYAYDASVEMVRITKRSFGHLVSDIHCHRHDQLQLPRPAQGVMACASLLFLEPGDLGVALGAFRRNLAPGGVLLADFKKGPVPRPQPDGRVYHDRMPADLDWLAELAGLEPVQVRESPDVLGRAETWLTFVLKAPD